MRDPVSSDVFRSWLPAAPDQVWATLTCAAATERFFHGLSVASTWRPGDAVTLTPTAAPTARLSGTVLRAVPGAEVAFTIEEPSGTTTFVTVVLRRSGDGCVITLTVDESPADAEPDREAVEDAWLAVVEGLRGELARQS